MCHRGEQEQLPSLTICLHGNSLNKAALQEAAQHFPTTCRDRIESDSTILTEGRVYQRSYRADFDRHKQEGSKGDLSFVRQGIDVDATRDICALLLEEQYHVQALDLR